MSEHITEWFDTESIWVTVPIGVTAYCEKCGEKLKALTINALWEVLKTHHELAHMVN